MYKVKEFAAVSHNKRRITKGIMHIGNFLLNINLSNPKAQMADVSNRVTHVSLKIPPSLSQAYCLIMTVTNVPD